MYMLMCVVCVCVSSPTSKKVCGDICRYEDTIKTYLCLAGTLFFHIVKLFLMTFHVFVF